MIKQIYRGAIARVIIALITLWLGISLGIFVNSPKYYPDRWLRAEKEVGDFFGQITLPIKLAKLSWHQPDQELLMPILDVRIRDIEDSWMSPRSDGRFHEGQDIFATRGTPVFSATDGYIINLGVAELGGNFVYIAGAGGRKYYYAHFDRIAQGMGVGTKVTTDTVIGFVGNTGDAINTPTHLHFGVYMAGKAINPLPLLVNR